ncbi:hypothetical protein [Lujinxingia litoralis]|uniref:hypothetical protein n=1 Tax=Lujinxingia litoralis TaxID=2211119 RepID=UPI0013141BF8|nr:hypothetical protein [Lujinxingia litoralis]
MARLVPYYNGARATLQPIPGQRGLTRSPSAGSSPALWRAAGQVYGPRRQTPM